jgi:putative ABC transport system permease protein
VIKVALRALWGRKFRTILTALAIVLGVATVTGTYVLTDSIKDAFNSIFQTIYVGTDASITGKSAIDANSTNNLPSFNESLLAKVRTKVPAAAAEIGGVGGEADLINRKNKVIGYGGAPHIGFSVDPSQPRFNSIVLQKGSWPGTNEVAIDTDTASKNHFKPGDSIDVQGNGPVQHLKLSGVFKFTSRGNIGGATLAAFDLQTAQLVFGKRGKLDEIRVALKRGYTEKQLLSQIRNILPPATQVRSGAAQAKKAAQDTTSFVDFLQTFLLAFGGIALFVGSFVIANSLSITIAQRTREFATLRTIGASRRQILRAVLVESIVMAVLASVAGLFLGLGLAKVLFWLFGKFGFTLPNAGLLLQGRTIVVALLVGILVTVVASLRPALRATRVPPIAAVREGVQLPPGRFARLRVPASATLGLLGFALVLLALFVVHGTTGVLAAMGFGAFFVFLGVAFFSSQLVVPLAHVLGWPATKVGGAAGLLARENSMRNPQRTASTAASLMIGLALVTLVTMLAQGIRASFFQSVDKVVTADYAVTAQDDFSPITLETEKQLRTVPNLTVVGVRGDDARIFGGKHTLAGISPGASKVVSFDWTPRAGSQSTLDSLGATGAVVTTDFAKKHHLTLGSNVPVVSTAGRPKTFTVKGIFKPPAASPFQGSVWVSSSAFDHLYTSPMDLYVFAHVPGGVSSGTTAELKKTLAGFPNAKVQTRSQFKTNQASFIGQILNILYVLLGLSVIVSLFGIVNTLVLSVFERTREIGMLRAVGTTRWQIRSMISLESVVTSLMGAAIGIGLGIVLAVLLIIRVDFLVLSWPIGSLIVFALAAVIVGLFAALLPARRAAKLNVLEALHYE